MVSTGTPRLTASHTVSLPEETITPVHFAKSCWKSARLLVRETATRAIQGLSGGWTSGVGAHAGLTVSCVT